MTVHIRFEKEAKNRRRKAPGTSGDSWNTIKNDLWRLVFEFDVTGSSFAFKDGSSSKLFSPKVFNQLCEDPSRANTVSDKQNKKDRTPSVLQSITKTASEQALGLTKEFKQNGLPWTGPQCHSILAGTSGILYCLPCFICKGYPIMQSVWLIQTILSILADYVYIDRDSWFHGIDRIFATSNGVAIIARGALRLNPCITPLLFIPCIGSFILANKAKQQLNLQAWIYGHFLWHLTSSLAVALTAHLLYNCPDSTESSSTDDFLLNHFC